MVLKLYLIGAKKNKLNIPKYIRMLPVVIPILFLLYREYDSEKEVK